MITNREEVIDKAFKVFLRMNYEKANISTLAKACGVVKTEGSIFFSHRLDLFMAVADKYVIQMQTPANKFAGPTETLAEFIEQYVAGVSAVMNHIIKQVQCCADDNECCPNFYYFHSFHVRDVLSRPMKNGENIPAKGTGLPEGGHTEGKRER